MNTIAFLNSKDPELEGKKEKLGENFQFYYNREVISYNGSYYTFHTKASTKAKLLKLVSDFLAISYAILFDILITVFLFQKRLHICSENWHPGIFWPKKIIQISHEFEINRSVLILRKKNQVSNLKVIYISRQ